MLAATAGGGGSGPLSEEHILGSRYQVESGVVLYLTVVWACSLGFWMCVERETSCFPLALGFLGFYPEVARDSGNREQGDHFR